MISRTLLRRISTAPKPTPTPPTPPPAEQPKAFVPPATPPPPPDARNLTLLARFQQKLVRDAENIEHQRQNPTEPSSNFLYRYDAKMDVRIKELEAAELKRKQEGLSTKMNPFANKIKSLFLDSEKNEKERLSMMDEGFKKGSFDDLKEVARKGDKLWEAKDEMKSASSCPRMPNITGKSLLGVETDTNTLLQHHRYTLFCFYFNALGEPHVKSYLTPFLAAHPSANIVQLNVEEDATKSWALKLFEPWIRRGVPVERRGQYLIHCGSILEERNRIGMTNRVLGWVHLVDGQGMVRWSAHGPAKEHEVAALIANAKILEAE
ncbi:Mitochondrial ATPase complex subunit atp10 [Podochytrium sp. JEL0797]|nr:Mitochondrial ATPase complex subunit atp10 [Podochytrium sp. JEL0797]